MMEHTHIADGTAVKLLVAGIVLASAAVGALGLAPVASQPATDALADGAGPELAFPIDNVTAAFPIDNFTAAFPIDNVTAAFPIDNVTASGSPWDVKGTDRVGDIGIGAPDASTGGLARMELPQDMDPY